MKQRTIATYLILLLFAWIGQAHAFNDENQHIRWITNFDEALAKAKEFNKPIVLFFTGSDWCGRCNKLEDESLNTPEFIREMSGKYIFVKLDFPLNATLDSKLTAQNKALQQKYEVRSFPTILLLDPQLKPVGVTGYRPGGGKAYADHIDTLYHDYQSYKQKIALLEKSKLSGKDLKQLYERSKQHQCLQDSNKIIQSGLTSDEKTFFLIEKYRCLASTGRIRDAEAKAVKQQLLNSDPENEKHSHYEVAIIDFEAYCDEPEKEDYSVDKAVEPLLAYINKFGSKDKGNLWKIQMIIAQAYLYKNELNKALKFAKASYDSAPASIQPDITLTIKSIQTQLHDLH